MIVLLSIGDSKQGLRHDDIMAILSASAWLEDCGAQVRFELCREKGSCIPPQLEILRALAPFLQSMDFHTVGDL